jgi:DNA-binding beta-propeller fold protein YncE
VLRPAHLPSSDEAKSKRREEYLLDSAHHGLAMNPSGTKLCAAGTMSDYAAIVDRASFAHTVIPVGPKPYWATNSARGHRCFVSVSGADAVSVISYRKEAEIARIPVGDHPQRMRIGKVRAGLLGTKKPKRRR